MSMYAHKCQVASFRIHGIWVRIDGGFHKFDGQKINKMSCPTCRFRDGEKDHGPPSHPPCITDHFFLLFVLRSFVVGAEIVTTGLDSRLPNK